MTSDEKAGGDGTTRRNLDALLSGMICTFISNTIVDHECSFYKFLTTQRRSPRLLYATSSFDLFFNEVSVLYFNNVFRALVRRDDDNHAHAVNFFDQLHAATNHSYVCLLHLVTSMYVQIHATMQRDNLDVSSSVAFERSLRDAIKPGVDRIRAIIVQIFNHDCNGPNLAELNPNIPLFSAFVVNNDDNKDNVEHLQQSQREVAQMG